MARSLVRRRRPKSAAQRRKNPARVRAGKKAARTRASRKTARRNPARKRRVTRVASKSPKRRVARRNPARRSAARRRRRNPGGGTAAAKAGSRRYAELKAQARDLGLSTKGGTNAIAARISDAMAPKRRKTKAKAKKGTRKTAARKTKTAPRRRKLSKKQAARRARAARRVTGKHTRRAKAIVRSKGKRRSTKKAIARTYLRGRSIAMRAKKGRLSKENTELARAMGLTRINPSMKAIGKDALVMLSRFGAAGAGVVSGVVVGLKVGTWLQAKLAASPVPGIIKNNMVPITTLGLGAAVWTVMKLGKRTQSWAMPVGLGFGAAGFVFMLTHTVMGRSMLAKAGIQIDVKAIAGNVATVADGTNAGLGSYVAGLGEYVQAGQGALEGYVTGDGEELQLAGHQGIFAGLGDAPDFYEASDDETYEIGEVGIFSGGSSI